MPRELNQPMGGNATMMRPPTTRGGPTKCSAPSHA